MNSAFEFVIVNDSTTFMVSLHLPQRVSFDGNRVLVRIAANQARADNALAVVTVLTENEVFEPDFGEVSFVGEAVEQFTHDFVELSLLD